MQQQNVFQYLKGSLLNSGMLGKLLLVNTVIFLVLIILRVVEFLFVKEEILDSVIVYLFAPGDPSLLKYTPWSVLTYMFTHYEVPALAAIDWIGLIRLLGLDWPTPGAPPPQTQPNQ